MEILHLSTPLGVLTEHGHGGLNQHLRPAKQTGGHDVNIRADDVNGMKNAVADLGRRIREAKTPEECQQLTGYAIILIALILGHDA